MSKRSHTRFAIRIKRDDIIQAYRSVISDVNQAALNSLMGIEGQLKTHEINEYIIACGLQLVQHQIKDIKIKDRQDRYRNTSIDQLTKSSLIENLKAGGHELAAAELEILYGQSVITETEGADHD